MTADFDSVFAGIGMRLPEHGGKAGVDFFSVGGKGRAEHGKSCRTVFKCFAVFRTKDSGSDFYGIIAGKADNGDAGFAGTRWKEPRRYA